MKPDPFIKRREHAPTLAQSLRIVGVYGATKALALRDMALLASRPPLLSAYVRSALRSATDSPYDERGFERALSARKAGVSKRTLTYGETPVFSARRFLEAAGVGAGASFLDLGCGRGRVLLAANHLGASRVAGVDLLAQHSDGLRDLFEPCGIELSRGDWFTSRLDGFSHVFIAWTCLSPRQRARLVRDVFAPAAPGTRIITLNAPLFSDAFQVERLGRYWFSWGPTPVFCSTRL